MHSEHLRNVQLSWVALGWLVGLSVASSVILVAIAMGIMDGSPMQDTVIVAFSVAFGWAVGGFSTGFKTAAAPILHGAAIALFTFVAWFGLVVAAGGITGGTDYWDYALPARSVAIALLVQGAAAITGCWVGYRYAPVRVE